MHVAAIAVRFSSHFHSITETFTDLKKYAFLTPNYNTSVLFKADYGPLSKIADSYFPA